MAITRRRLQSSPRWETADDDDGEDAQHWGEAMQRHERTLRSFFRSRVRNQSDVDDLVQDVFVQVLKRNTGEPVENEQHYLLRVAANVLCDQGRRMKARCHDAHASYDEGLHGIATEITPARIVIGEQALNRVAAALRQLPQRTQDVFFLRGIRQRRHKDVARMLGISQRVVHRHMSQALKHLAKALDEAE